MVKNRRAGRNAVRVVQVRLKDAGFDPGPIDGIDGIKTQSAVSAAQSRCTMVNDLRIASPKDEQAATADHAGGAQAGPMRVHVANRRSERFSGTTGKNLSREAVKVLQTRLREAGFDPGPIDGILGPRTKAAVQRYQSSFQ